jgi:mannose-6-phosphate isomerase-like protein (cupin superfamily)
MTLFRSDARPPAWCELDGFEIITLARGQSVRRTPGARERLIGALGTVQLRRGARSLLLKEAQFVDIDPMQGDPADGEYVVEGHADTAQFVRLSGHWGQELGGCGIFRVRPGSGDKGDPVGYRKNTAIDRHYHDCDEYWIVLEGAGDAVVDDRPSRMGPGDCLAIGMGHPHDFPWVEQDVKAVFFETTLQGRKRTGHLWNHTHGPAQPLPERI